MPIENLLPKEEISEADVEKLMKEARSTLPELYKKSEEIRSSLPEAQRKAFDKFYLGLQIRYNISDQMKEILDFERNPQAYGFGNYSQN